MGIKINLDNVYAPSMEDQGPKAQPQSKAQFKFKTKKEKKNVILLPLL